MRLAGEAGPARARNDPDAFLEPGGMLRKIAEQCRARGLAPPETPGEFTRTILESLAERYRQVLESLEALAGRRLYCWRRVAECAAEPVGGGCHGADGDCGPSEATAIGNVLSQAIGAGELGGLEEARDVVRRSFPVEVYRGWGLG